MMIHRGVAGLALVASILAGCESFPALKSVEVVRKRPQVALLEIGPSFQDRLGLGAGMDAKAIGEAGVVIDGLGVDAVVVIARGHGADLGECFRIARELQDIESKHRVVVWVSRAVLGVQVAIWGLDEIYMTSQASLGTASTWPAACPEQTIAFEEILANVNEVSAMSGRDPLILRATVIPKPLSVTLQGGAFRWYPDDNSGEMVVNRRGEFLYLNAHTAGKVGVSKGTADTLEELLLLAGLNGAIVRSEANERLRAQSEAREMEFDHLDFQYSKAARHVAAAEEATLEPTVDQAAFDQHEAEARQAISALRHRLANLPARGRFALDMWRRTTDDELACYPIDALERDLSVARKRLDRRRATPVEK
jgi:hypothetical protein